MLFSERKGLKSVRKTLQVGALDELARTAVWNAFHRELFGPAAKSEDDDLPWEALEQLVPALWEHFFSIPLDQMKQYTMQNVAAIRKWFFDEHTPWYRILDFVEFTCSRLPKRLSKTIERDVNAALERESAAYRIVKGVIVEVTDPVEVEEIECAYDATQSIPGGQEHIRRSLQLLGDRDNPDYRNTIKEAISAVEAICQTLAGQPSASLNEALKRVEKHVEIHPALKRALGNLYGYTSDADGVRHAMLELPQLTHSDAKFMVVICSAFVNYLIVKASPTLPNP